MTSGYTVENYIPTDVLQQAVRDVHPSKRIKAFTKYDNPLGVEGINKNAVARKAAPNLTADNYVTLDLKKRLRDLAAFIRRANEQVVVTDSD